MGGGGSTYRETSRYGEEEEEGYGSAEDDFVFEMTKVRLKVSRGHVHDLRHN